MIRTTAWLAAAALFAHFISAAHAQPTDVAALASYQGADREQRLLAGAKREGELKLYTSMQIASIAPMQRAFEKKYGVRITIWRGSGKDVLRRVITEAKAGRADVDIMESDGFALEALHREGLLEPVHSPHLDDLIPPALRPHRQWVGTRVNVFSGVYNTKLIKQEMLPKSYDDLVDPRFKGLLGIEAEDYDWFGMVVGLLGEEKGLKLFRDILAKNGLSVRRGHTLLTNLVAAGEVPIGLTVFLQNVDVARNNGAPVMSFLIPPTVARANGIALAKRSPRPHAALLFYDFMLGEGQRIMLQRSFLPTSRKIPSVLSDITINFVDPQIVLDGGEKWQRLYRDVVLTGGR
jgi:iron(III) transport system substrate-binding protein